MTLVWRGQPFPLGARWDGQGTNFSLFSERSESVELCLFDEDDNETRIAVQHQTAHNWHVYLPGVGPRQRYGYRVHGPYQPEHGLSFNAAKLLLDPYAKAIVGAVRPDAANVLPYVPDPDNPDADLEPDDEDSAPAMPRCVVVDESFDWEDDRHPRRRWAETVIYETHVKGFTKCREDARQDLRGTYAAMASEPAIAYLRDLGVTAVELLPVHHIIDESFLVDRGLSNYWGYSSVGYLAPHGGYAATGALGEQVREFKGMVKALHRAGIEVILDVVYNHTAEGNHLGPMLCFRGVDNPAYYRLMPDDPLHYMDFTGTGNSLNPVQPAVLRLIMDSLRYWVIDCHVDGFRFDLAAALAREFFDVDRLSAFFDVIYQDPVLSQVKLIAGTSDPADTRSATSRCCGRSGTACTATRCATSGAATPASPSSLLASRGQATSTSQTADAPSPRSTSSPLTTASRCATWCPTTRSAMMPTASRAATAPTTTARGTAARRDPPTIRRSRSCASASSATSSPRCFSPRGCRCCSAATSSAAPRTATTTPGVRTTESRGTAGSARSGSGGCLRSRSG